MPTPRSQRGRTRQHWNLGSGTTDLAISRAQRCCLVVFDPFSTSPELAPAVIEARIFSSSCLVLNAARVGQDLDHGDEVHPVVPTDVCRRTRAGRGSGLTRKRPESVVLGACCPRRQELPRVSQGSETAGVARTRETDDVSHCKHLVIFVRVSYEPSMFVATCTVCLHISCDQCRRRPPRSAGQPRTRSNSLATPPVRAASKPSTYQSGR